jgi:hypothetical protein
MPSDFIIDSILFASPDMDMISSHILIHYISSLHLVPEVGSTC